MWRLFERAGSYDGICSGCTVDMPSFLSMVFMRPQSVP